MHAKAASEKPDDSGFVFGRRWSNGETFMTANTKQPPLHIALGYSGISDSEIAAEALAAHDGIKAQPEFFCARKTPAQDRPTQSCPWNPVDHLPRPPTST